MKSKCTDKEIIEALKAANSDKQECINRLVDKLTERDNQIIELENKLKEGKNDTNSKFSF